MQIFKKILVSIVCCLVLFSNLQTKVFAEELTTTQNNITYLIDTDTQTAKITSGKPTSGKIVIPDEIMYESVSYPVTSIGPSAFEMKSYKELIIGKNIERIEAFAFGNSFDLVSKIQFNDSKCQTISADAFDWMDFKNLQIIVYGPQGCMDDVINGVIDLKPYVGSITYITPEILQTTENLQNSINTAPDNQETIIVIEENISLTKTITIPANKQIVLRDDGSAREIKALNIGSVSEMFIVEKNASLTFEETSNGSLTFVGANITSSYEKGNIVKVKGSFYLKSGTLTGANGGYIKVRISGAVVLDRGAYFEMSGGTIKNFYFDQTTALVLTAPVIVPSGAEFVMSGGTISNNNNNYTGRGYQSVCGGVLLYTWGSNKETPAKMTMTGNATIKSNIGGGVLLVNNTDFVMDGGFITDNRTNSMGGGVCVSGDQGGVYGHKTKFTMKNGTIARNFSLNSGGGIYVNSSDVYLEGGYITDNEAHKHGGGIYVSITPHILHMYNAVITENRATLQGGGMWLCPTGTAEMHINNGSAIFDNKALSDKGYPAAGDDLAFVGGGENKGKVTLANRLLGGGKVTYYRDGAVYNTNELLQYLEQGAVDESVPRFDPNNPGEPITSLGYGESCALKFIASDDAKELAKSVGKLFITGNKATRGGGVGSNGGIVIGEHDEYTLIINKVWDEEAPYLLLKPVTVYLKVGDTLLDKVELNKENNWTVTLTNLPNPDSLNNLEYSAVENPIPEEFQPEYSPAIINKETKTITISVKNVFTPEDPVPDTGDSSIVKLYIGIASLSLIAMILAHKERKRFEKKYN